MGGIINRVEDELKKRVTGFKDLEDKLTLQQVQQEAIKAAKKSSEAILKNLGLTTHRLEDKIIDVSDMVVVAVLTVVVIIPSALASIGNAVAQKFTKDTPIEKIARSFSNACLSCVSSIKSNIGHLEKSTMQRDLEEPITWAIENIRSRHQLKEQGGPWVGKVREERAKSSKDGPGVGQ